MVDMDTTLIVIGPLVLVGTGLILKIVQLKRQKKRAAELRQRWRQKISETADDLTTDPNGWSLQTIIECLDEPEWEEICHELEKMPAGKRSLQKAIEITDRDDYKRGV